MKNIEIKTELRNMTQMLKDIADGVVQVPMIQRDFVWDPGRVKMLFDSVNNSFPIGSVILWKPSEIANWDGRSHIGSYEIPAVSPTPFFILDGFQRLSCLLGCLYDNEKAYSIDTKMWDTYFNLYYDANEDSFVYLKKSGEPEPGQFPLNVLLTTTRYRKYFNKNLKNVDDEKRELILSKTDLLIDKLKNYQLVSIKIENAEIKDAAEVFNRVNSLGTIVSEDWMAHALSYDYNDGQVFVLKDEIDNILASLQPYHFDNLDRNFIFKCIQSSFDHVLYYNQKSIESLVQRNDFKDVVSNVAAPAIEKTAKFLYEELHVIDYQLLPYDQQFVFITHFFENNPDPTDSQLDELKQWFWRTSYSNFFTIAKLSTQQKEFVRIGSPNSVGDDENSEINQLLLRQPRSFPEQFNLRNVRTKTLALFVVNNICNKCNKTSDELIYRVRKYDLVEKRTTENIMLTDAEEIAYKRLFQVPHISLHIMGEPTGYNRKFDEDLLDAAFFVLDNGHAPSLSKRKDRMQKAESEFMESLGFIREQI